MIGIIFEIIIFSIGILALVLKSGIINKKKNNNFLIFFTNLVTIICVIYYLVYVVYFLIYKESNEILYNIKGSMGLYTLVTFIIYNFILVPKHKKDKLETKIYSFSDVMIHIVLPIFVLIDLFIFRKNYSINVISPILWLIVPILYILIVFTKGIFKIGNKIKYLDGYYPYYFLNLDEIGIKKVIINIIILILLFVLLGYIIYFVSLI